MVSAAEEVCGTIKRGSSKRRDAWWNDEVKEAVKKKKKAWLDYLASSNDKDMREKMKERYKLQKVHTKALIEEVSENILNNDTTITSTSNYNSTPSLFVFLPTTESEVLDIILNLKSDFAVGLDNISTSFLYL
ncbi:unnamed protein product [Parnassius mnemosyne]|uniref:Uncharacterized protein n=1 Tax=Parnassius mnemosyne TaxID=213953 RepID=A0AAV1L041_9NEOP